MNHNVVGRSERHMAIAVAILLFALFLLLVL